MALEVTMTAVAMLISKYRVEHAPGHPETEFNTTNSEQILGFTEPVNGAYITLAERPPSRQRVTARDEQGGTSTPSIATTSRETLSDAPLNMAEVAKHANKDSCWIVIS